MGWIKFRKTDSGWNLDFHPDIIQDENSTEVVFRERHMQKSKCSTRQKSTASVTPSSKTSPERVESPVLQVEKSSETDKDDKGKTRFYWIMAIILLVLVALAIALAILFRGQEEEPPSQTTNKDVDEEINSFVPISNDQCDAADLIIPDGSSEVGVLSSTAPIDVFSNGIGQCGNATYGTSSGKWYQVELPPGVTSDVLTLEACVEDCAVSSASLILPEVSIFTGTCTDLECVDGTADWTRIPALSFAVENGQTYYIFIQGSQGSMGLYDVTLSL